VRVLNYHALLRDGIIEHVSESSGAKPPGWPDKVDGPGRHGGPWEQSAAKWLFDQVPGEWREGLNGRQYRQHPLMLARDALYLAEGQLQALREAYRRARVELAENFEPQQIEEQLEMYQLEGRRLEQLGRQVQLVYDALSGVRWVPRA
jgi:hypothetical protein